MSSNITTGKVRFSYLSVFTPRKPNQSSKDGEDEKYSVTLLIPKQDQATYWAIMAGIDEAKQEGISKVFGGSIPAVLALPLHDGDGMKESGEPYGAECRGCWVMTASNKSQPSIVDVNVQPILQQSQVYSGCYGRASIRFFPYGIGKKGIGCGLSGIQKLEDGEPLGGGISAEEAFGGHNSYGQPAAGGVYPNSLVPGYSQPGAGYPASQPQFPAAAYQMPAQNQQPAPMLYQQSIPYQQPAPYQQPMPYQQTIPQYQYQQPPAPMVDPVTGRPMAGGVMGI